MKKKMKRERMCSLNWMVILPENSRCCVKNSGDFHNKRLSDGMEMHKGSKKVKKRKVR